MSALVITPLIPEGASEELDSFHAWLAERVTQQIGVPTKALQPSVIEGQTAREVRAIRRSMFAAKQPS